MGREVNICTLVFRWAQLGKAPFWAHAPSSSMSLVSAPAFEEASGVAVIVVVLPLLLADALALR